MKNFRLIAWILEKEFRLELRSKYAISGILLYVLSTVLMVALTFVNIEPAVWNILFWIIFLFVSVHTLVRAFQEESQKAALYYYQLVHPMHVYAAKLIYHTLLLWVLGGLIWLALTYFGDNPVAQPGMFVKGILMGGFSMATLFTFIAGLASKADNSATLVTVLGFPLVLASMMALTRLSAKALEIIPANNGIKSELITLLGIDLVLLAVGVVLFPWVWRD